MTIQELIKLVEDSTGYNVMSWHYEVNYAAIRVLLSSQNTARVYANGKMCYLINGFEDMQITPRASLASQAKRVATAVLGYNEGTVMVDKGCDQRARLTVGYHDQKEHGKTTDEEKFWEKVRKLQYHRARSEVAT